LKKIGKTVQAARLEEKETGKNEMLERVKVWKMRMFPFPSLSLPDN